MRYNKLKIVTFLAFILFSYNAACQKKLDSLLNVINSTCDTNTVNAYLDVLLLLQYSDVDSAIYYGEKGIALGRELGLKEGVGYGLHNISRCYLSIDEYSIADKYLNEALMIFIDLENNEGVYYCYNTLGGNNVYLGNYDVAIENFEKSLEFLKQNNDTVNHVRCLSNIAYVYYYKGDYSNAITYFHRALYLNQKIGDKKNEADIQLGIGNLNCSLKKNDDAERRFHLAYHLYNEICDSASMGVCLRNLGSLYYSTNQYQKAIILYHKSLQIWQSYKSPAGKIKCYNSIGFAYFELQEFLLSEKYFETALLQAEEIGSKDEIAMAANGLAQVNFELGNYDLVIEYSNMAMEISEKTESLSNMNASLETLSDTYAQLGDYKKAYEYHQLFKEKNDSLYNIETTSQLNEIQTKYETEKKEKEIIKLNEANKIKVLEIEKERRSKQTQLFIFIVIIVVVILSSTIVYFLYKSKKNAAMAKLQKSRFRDVIEAEEKERKRIAADLHDSVGLMLATTKLNLSELDDTYNCDSASSEILNSALDLIDETSMEVRNISHNMMPGALIELGLLSALKGIVFKINQNHKINVNIKSNCQHERFYYMLEITVYRIFQEIISNTIKHSKATEVEVCLFKENSLLVLNVKDNGVGINKNSMEKSTGIGWKNIYSRLTILNGHIDFNNDKDNGTTIKIVIPLEY